MLKSASKFWPRTLAALAIALAVFAASSFFVGEFISAKTKSAVAGSPEVRAWIGSMYGQLCLGFERIPPAFESAMEKGTTHQTPRLHIASIGPNLRISCQLVGSVPANSTMNRWWWFHLFDVDFQAPLPTTNPFVTTPGTVMYPIRIWQLSVPYWVLMLPSGVHMVYRLVDLPGNRRRRRFAAGQCIACGYDLRHTPDRCPECGLVPVTSLPLARRFPQVRSIRGGTIVQICLYSILIAVWTAVFVVAYYRFYRR